MVYAGLLGLLLRLQEQFWFTRARHHIAAADMQDYVMHLHTDLLCLIAAESSDLSIFSRDLQLRYQKGPATTLS